MPFTLNGPTFSTVIELLPWLLTNRNLSSTLSSGTLELRPAGGLKGEPSTGVNNPVSGASVKTSTAVSVTLASATVTVPESQVTSIPVAFPLGLPNGRGGWIDVREPSDPMLNMATEPCGPSLGRTTARKLPSGVTLMPSG